MLVDVLVDALWLFAVLVDVLFFARSLFAVLVDSFCASCSPFAVLVSLRFHVLFIFAFLLADLVVC
ncbi:hypothetical protein, partial [Staphylococcus haemolyticus]|uniref:hypothetical protein n=1 Tax=Staphylococcus haemolyticus TaxID=1283 RepID=UPI001C5CB94F